MTPDVVAILNELYDAEPENRLDDPDGSRLYDPPMVRVADADDPWFARLKQVIGPYHWTPQEALAPVAPADRARSVVCWCLPVGEVIRKSNRTSTQFASRSWAWARSTADRILQRMEEGLVGRLRASGFAAVAPARLPQNTAEARGGVKLSSCWSQRHVAFVAGLGTFGISGGLITLRGIAHRLGSIVTDLFVEPTPRAYGDDPFAWCLRMSRGACGACIARCPVASIGATVHARNKPACFEHREHTGRRARELYGWEAARYGCGLCQTAVPCEFRNPTADGAPP